MAGSKSFKPGPSVSYKTACAPSEDSDQPAHSRSLIRVYEGALWVAKDPKRLQADSECAADLGLRLAHMHSCRKRWTPAQLSWYTPILTSYSCAYILGRCWCQSGNHPAWNWTNQGHSYIEVSIVTTADDILKYVYYIVIIIIIIIIIVSPRR